MYFVPLIYFLGLTYFFWQKHRCVDLATYISALFTLTSLCGVLMIAGGYLSGSGVLADGWDPEFGFVPTILYCSLITLTIYPFSFIRPEKIVHISNIHRYAIYAFSFFIILQGLAVAYLVGDFLSDLLNGDFKFLKDSGYAGDITPADAKMMTMPMPVQVMYLLCSMTLLGIPLFFYYSCIEKRSLWLSVPVLAASISPVLRGILSADRAEIMHYGLMFVFTLILFQKHLTKAVKRFLATASVPVLLIGMVYVVAVSSSRFEDTNEGTGGSMLEYAGQPYANFCYFYDNHNADLYYFEREFPLTSYFVYKSQYTDTKDERGAKEGFFIGVFATHVGSWLLDAGTIGCSVICMLFFIICCWVIKQYNRDEFDIADVLMIFVLGAVPTFGIFYYRYYSIATAFIYVPTIILYVLSKFVVVWKQEPQEEINKT